MSCEDKSQDIEMVKISKKILKLLRYLKEPVENVSELYNRYPDGGEWGWFCVVTSLNTIAVWSVEGKKWQVIGGSGDAAVQSDWEEEDEKSLSFILNKPDLNEIKSNEPYLKYYPDVIESWGVYEVHKSKALMYIANIDSDIELTQAENENENYGTTYMVFCNIGDEDVEIYLSQNEDESIYAVGFDMDEPLILSPDEIIEIAFKAYGTDIIVTQISGSGIVIPEQMQADWDEQNTGSAAFIKNKPKIPDAQIQADWKETDNKKPSFIQNKPNIPDAQVQADWNETDDKSLAYIHNKPDLKNITTNEPYTDYYDDILTKNGGYRVHPSKDLMYKANISTNIELGLMENQDTLPKYGTTFILLYNESDKDVEIEMYSVVNDINKTLHGIGFEINESLKLGAYEWIEIAVKGYDNKFIATCISGTENGKGISGLYYNADIYPYELISGRNVLVHPTKEYSARLDFVQDNTVFTIGGVYDQFWYYPPEFSNEYRIDKCFGTTYLLIENKSNTDAVLKLPDDSNVKYFPEDTAEITIEKNQRVEMAFRGIGGGQFICTFIYDTDENKNELRNSGSPSQSEILYNLETVHVNPNYTGDQEDGSVSFPYKTITKALQDAKNSYPVILLEKGDYTGEGTITIERDCMLTSLFGSLYPIVWLPTLIIKGEDVTLKNVLSFKVTVEQPSGGSLIFENCTIYQQITVEEKTEIYFKNCFFYMSTGQIVDNSNNKNSYIYIFDSFQVSLYLNSGRVMAFNSSFVPLKNSGKSEVESNDAVYLSSNATAGYFTGCSFTYNSTWACDQSYRLASWVEISYVCNCNMGNPENHTGKNIIYDNIANKIYGASTNAQKLHTVIEGMRTDITALQNEVTTLKNLIENIDTGGNGTERFEEISIKPTFSNGSYRYSFADEKRTRLYCKVEMPEDYDMGGECYLNVDNITDNSVLLFKIENIGIYASIAIGSISYFGYFQVSELSTNVIFEVKKVFGQVMVTALNNN